MSSAVDNKAQNNASNDAKPQRQRNDRKKNNDAQRANGGAQQNGRESPQPNGRQTPDQNKNQKQNNKQKDGEKKPIVANERFDNSAYLASEGSNEQDPVLSMKLSESKRINEVIPTGLSQEVRQKVQRIQEAFPNYEFHVVYGILEQNRFDEHQVMNLLAENKVPQQQQQQSQQGRQKKDNKPAVKLSDQLANTTAWASVVKRQSDQQQSTPQQHQPAQQQPHPQQQQQQYPPLHQAQHQQPPHPQQQPQQQQHVQHQQPPQHMLPPQQAQAPYMNPVLQGLGLSPMFAGVPSSNPEEVVKSLSSAISEQLQAIMEKSRQLMAMQEELNKITSTEKTEMQMLIDRKAQLQDEQRRLHEQLRQNEINLQQVDEQIAAKEREKVLAIHNLTSKGAELGVTAVDRFAAPVAGGAQGTQQAFSPDTQGRQDYSNQYQNQGANQGQQGGNQQQPYANGRNKQQQQGGSPRYNSNYNSNQYRGRNQRYQDS